MKYVRGDGLNSIGSRLQHASFSAAQSWQSLHVLWSGSLSFLILQSELLPPGVAAVTAFSIRFAVFGKLPPNVFDSLPRQITHAAIYWLVVKFGILGATLYLLLAAGIGLFLRWSVAFLVQAFVLLALVMMIGNLIQSCAVNISLVLRRLGRPQDNI